MKKEVKRGDIFYCELDGKGSVQRNRRPCVVVSNDKANTFSPVITVAPITSNIKNSYLPTHVMIELTVMSVIMAEQTTLIDKSQIDGYIGHCDAEVMERIDEALLIQFGISDSDARRENRVLRKKLLEYKRLLLSHSLLPEKDKTTKIEDCKRYTR